MNKVSQTTIVNCFKKFKISEKDQTMVINVEDDPFKEVKENLKELWEKEPNLVPENMAAEEFATADNAVITTSSTCYDEEILQEAAHTENVKLWSGPTCKYNLSKSVQNIQI